jgi:hypothetical protein
MQKDLTLQFEEMESVTAPGDGAFVGGALFGAAIITGVAIVVLT